MTKIKLREINIDSINEKFGDFKSFSNQINSSADKLFGEEKTVLKEILLHYRNLFAIETIVLEDDTREFFCLAEKAIDILDKIKDKSNVVLFLINRIKLNINHVENVIKINPI